MDSRLACLLLVLVINSTSATASSENLNTTDLMEVDLSSSRESAQAIVKTKQLCGQCEEFAWQGLFHYLIGNQTQEDTITNLQKSCSEMHSFEQQCKMLVDYYVPLFFTEISMMQPDQFCEEVNPCGETALAGLPDVFCKFCHNTAAKLLAKLKDPRTKASLIKTLLVGCKVLGKLVPKCNAKVTNFVPLFLISAQIFLSTRDVCKVIHVCKKSQGEVIDSAIASA